jgi:hypothetical protein
MPNNPPILNNVDNRIVETVPLSRQEGDSTNSNTSTVTSTTTPIVTNNPNPIPSPPSVTNVRTPRTTKGSWKDGPAGKKKDYVTYQVLANKVSLDMALSDNTRGKHVLKAIYDEIDNLEQPGVLKPIYLTDIPNSFRKDIINAYMFHKEKYKADGSFDKDKCRIVLLSNQRDPDTIGESFSPTVNPISVMTMLNLAAVKKETLISAYDIKGAFLLTPMNPNKRMFIRVKQNIVKHWIAKYPKRSKFIESDGCLYFELKRFVYGLHEAPHEFNNFVDSHLTNLGFKATKADKCLYTKDTEDGKLILSLHVDDMLLSSPNKHWQIWFESEMEKHFELSKQYDKLSYLGIQIRKESNGDIRLTQQGYIETILKRYRFDNLAKTPKTPSTDNMLTDDDEAKPINKKDYLSLTMALMYVARFTRPDILFSVSYLATKCSNPNEWHFMKLKRILKYLAGTQNEGMTFRSDVPFVPAVYVDASHLIHQDGRGHHGMLITNGSAPVGYRSVKLKLMTRSSSETELVSLEDSATYAIWYILLLKELGTNFTKPITIYQDNKSTIIMAAQGPNFKRTKHLMGREMFIKEHITNNDIKLKYVDSKNMVADILTKSLDAGSIKYLKTKLNIT